MFKGTPLDFASIQPNWWHVFGQVIDHVHSIANGSLRPYTQDLHHLKYSNKMYNCALSIAVDAIINKVEPTRMYVRRKMGLPVPSEDAIPF